MKAIKAGSLIDILTSSLEISQHKLARLMDVDPHTLSNNRDSLISELTPKTQQKLISIYDVVINLGALKSEVLLDVLQRHVFEDEDGRKDSVISAIQQNKYSLEIIKEIAETARLVQHRQYVMKYPDVSDAITVSA